MAEKQKSKPVSWWQTLPGMLTGLAAIITAITGLILALNQTGTLNKILKPAGKETTTTPDQPSTSSPTSHSDSAAVGPEVSLPAGMEVKLGGGDTVVKVLSAKVEPYNAEKRMLKFTVRYTNNRQFPANFWSDSYRLLVDETPRAPTNSLNEIVPSQSAKEGEVDFEVPVEPTRVVLQISSGSEKTQIPFQLK